MRRLSIFARTSDGRGRRGGRIDLLSLVMMSLFCVTAGSGSASASVLDFSVSGQYLAFNHIQFAESQVVIGESLDPFYDSIGTFQGTVVAQDGIFVAGDILTSGFGEFNVFASGTSKFINLEDGFSDLLQISFDLTAFDPGSGTSGAGAGKQRLGAPIISGFILGVCPGAPGAGAVTANICADIGSATAGAGAGKGIRFADNFSGTAVLTPIPAALPLFAGGLGVLGLLARRRKRRAAAARAA